MRIVTVAAFAGVLLATATVGQTAVVLSADGAPVTVGTNGTETGNGGTANGTETGNA